LTDVAVVVPWRGGCSHREHAWEWVRAFYAERYSGWELIEARAPEGPWCKAAAVNPEVEATAVEIVIIADADVWCDGIPEAVAAVDAGAPFAIPHLKVHRLTKEGTEAVLAGGSWRGQSLVQPPYEGFEGGGIVVSRREVLERVPLDCRFVNWGQEDECHAMALRTLVGVPWRGKAPLVHLWHPPQPRASRRRGSKESWELRRRYVAARKDPIAMAELLVEGAQ